jgi:glycosyltransferase involved in cell wall biosynthesis
MAILAEFEPDVIHSHDQLQMAHSALVYRKKTGVPVVLTTHQVPSYIKAYLPKASPFNDALVNIFWSYGRWLLHQIDAVITPTQTIADLVYTHTGAVSQVIPYGIDPKVFCSEPLNDDERNAWLTRLGLPDREPILLHVGRLDKDKRVEVVIRAAARIISDFPAHLLIVGDGTEKGRLMQLCQELGIAACSHFPGFITADQGLPDIYRLATTFITASEIETQGLVLLEAAVCGLPIAAVRATCIPEIVREGENGYLAEPGDVDGMAACIRRLLNNPRQARAMGIAGARIAQEITLQKTLTDTEGVYRRVTGLANRPCPVPSAAGSDCVRLYGGSG